jgi:hypothetical protein
LWSKPRIFFCGAVASPTIWKTTALKDHKEANTQESACQIKLYTGRKESYLVFTLFLASTVSFGTIKHIKESNLNRKRQKKKKKRKILCIAIPGLQAAKQPSYLTLGLQCTPQ